MKKLRKIIQIDEELCNGCGQCIIGCAEGALQLVDGKAKLVGEVYCDGLGACIGECPEGALTIIEREADEFDEAAVEELLASQKASEAAAPELPLACGCPSNQDMVLSPGAAPAPGQGSPAVSTLGHWPIKLGLLGPGAPFLKDADLLLLADCAAASLPNLHADFLGGKAVALACPKLDDAAAHIDRLGAILAGARPKSITVVHMEVPCCMGLDFIAKRAMDAAGVRVPLGRIQIGRDGRVLERVEPAAVQAA